MKLIKNMAGFIEKDLTCSRKTLYRILQRGYFQSDNEANLQSESLWYQTREQVEKVENPD